MHSPSPGILRELWILLMHLDGSLRNVKWRAGPPRSCKLTAMPYRDWRQGHMCERDPGSYHCTCYSSPALNGEGGGLPASCLGSMLVSASPWLCGPGHVSLPTVTMTR